MKKITSFPLLTILIALSIIFQSCKEESTAPPPDDNVVIIPETTKSVDSTDYSSNLVGISSDSLTFTFESGFASKYEPAVNDILAITNGAGLLRKITAIQTSGSSTVLTTEQATLEEAIEEGNISLKQNLQETQIDKVDYYYDGIKYKINKGTESNFEFDMDIILYDLDGNPNTTNDQVKLKGNFILEASVLFEAKISKFKLRNAKIGLEATNSESLELIAQLNYNIQKEITLATVRFSPIYFQLGPLPVVIVIKLNIKAGGSGYANASMNVGFENSVDYEAGINYVRGQGWNTYSVFDNDFNFIEPVLKANAGARIYVKPEISVGVYGVLAGYANTEAYGEVLVDLVNSPWWQLYAGLDFGVGARAKIFGFEIFDFEKNVLELRWLLAEAAATGESCPGIPTVTDSRNGKIYHTLLIGDQCWLRENLNVGVRIDGSKPQTNNSVIEKYCYDDDPANCNTFGGLYQWNEAMQYAVNQGAQGICPPGWHIPTQEEFMNLAMAVAGDGNSLKAPSQGTGAGAGTNTTGFSSLLAGIRWMEGEYESFGEEAYYWSSDQYDTQSSSSMSLESESKWIYIGENEDKNYGYSIRCIKD